MKRVVLFLLFGASVSAAHAWGAVGHRMVAETAALLVADDLPAGWGPLLARHRFELGVYAFLPDALFGHIDGAGGKIEAPTHFLHLDAAGDDPSESGALDRRIAQLLAVARDDLAPVRRPEGGYLRGATATGDTHRVFLGIYDLGVLAHYSGDASMPYHATADWNGYARGEGGIHFYFENDCVNALEPGLSAEVLSRARKNRKAWRRAWAAASSRTPSPLAAVLADSLDAVRTVSGLDRRHAVIELASPGTSANASRRPAADGCRAMRPVLIDRLAKGAVLTAELWESVLPAGVSFDDASALQFSDMQLSPAYPAPR